MTTGGTLHTADYPRNPTLAEVAHAAGVGLKTASRAMNGEPHVAEATRDRVLAAASRLGFRMNPLASSLARGSSPNVVSLITGDLTNPFYAAIASGAEREIRDRDYRLMLASSAEDPEVERKLLEDVALRHARAVLLVTTQADHASYDAVQRRGIPIVFLDRGPQGIEADSYVLDNYGGARQAVEQLIGLGHRRIAYIGDYSRLAPQQTRFQAYADAMEEAGLDWHEAVVPEAHDIASAECAARDLLSAQPAPTALFTANNRITIGALRALTDLAPQTALIGFDDFELADVLGVTTVSHDPETLGLLAARRALELAAAPLPLQAAPGVQTVLPAEVVRRGSGERPPAA